MAPVSLTIHRGTHEVGGTCIELVAGKSRLILDVGLPLFNQDREPLDSLGLRRKSTSELQAAGFLPKVPGLFEDGIAPDAILLSHAHEDHTGLIRHSKSEIPIYASVGTSKMMLAGAKFAGQPYLPQPRFRELRPGRVTQVGHFSITAFPVDHSIFGSQALLIEAEGKSVLYSGDLRLHGRKPELHRSLIAALKDRSIDVLLMEGTHIEHTDYRGVTEFELEEEILTHIQSAPGVVLASFSPQHVDRLDGFLQATIRAGRVFVADAYAAFVMHLVASETDIPRPEASKHIRVFLPQFFVQKSARVHLDEFLEMISKARIEMEEVRANPSGFVMQFRSSMLNSDFDGSLMKKTRCLYSRWNGYLTQPEWNTVASSLNQADGDLIEVHTSGHIYFEDIRELVSQIQSTTLIPVHTFAPERFHHVASNVHVLSDGETFVIP